MKQTLYIDPRIRDNVFFPLIILMFLVGLLRFYITKIMAFPDNPLLKRASLSFNVLKKTLFENDADMAKEPPQQEFELDKALESIKDDVKNQNALARSTKIRKAADILPEDFLKLRKSYFCKEQTGYFNKTVNQNMMANMMNPDMMSGMLKQNVQGMFNIALFSVVGSLFSGFIIAQVPFPLGQKFKGLLQQGLKLTALDPSYVSSMSWCFLLIFGMQGLMSLLIGDTQGMDDMNMMGPNPMMMQQQAGAPGAQQNFTALFKAEKENYEILNYKFKLDDVEDAFLAKFRTKKI